MAWLLGLGVVARIGVSLYLVNGLPFLSGASGEEERGHAFSMFLALVPLGGFVGSLLASRLSALFAGLLGVPLGAPSPFRYSLWLGAVLLIPGVLALLATREVAGVSSPAAKHEAGPTPYRLVAVLGAVALLAKAAIAAPQTFFNVYLDAALRVAPALTGTLMAAVN